MNCFIFCLILYFIYHSVYGKRGVIAYIYLKQEYNENIRVFNHLKNKRLKLEHRNSLLRPKSLNIAIIKHYLSIEIPNIFCTKIASKLARTYTSLHGIKELWKDLLNLQLPKHLGSSYWGAKTLSKEQIDYAANDVLYLHQLRNTLKDMLITSNRLELAYKVFSFLPIRVELDLKGWYNEDIFSHE